MIIPYGHKGMELRGLPWGTMSIFVLCVIAFGLTSGPAARSSQEAGELFAEIAALYLADPSLEIDPELEDLVFQQFGVDDNQRGVFLESLRERASDPSRTMEPKAQRELDGLTRRFWSVYRGSPSYRLGVVPNHIGVLDLVTYQFLHGGWGHLLGNLLFLYLAAPHIEQRWGRSVFLTFYLLAGVVAALFWAIRYPDLDVPLVGASGSIAGLMGAFLICFGTSKIRFFYWFFIIWGTFEAPAWLMLPLWLVMEVVSGRTMDVLSQGDGGGGVAHWAHVWGFIFGMAFAWGMNVVGIDRRLADRNLVGDPGEEEIRRADRRERVTFAGTTPRADGHRPRIVRPAAFPQPTERPGSAELDDGNEPEVPLTGMGPEPEPAAVLLVEVEQDRGAIVEIRPAERLQVLEAIPRSLDGENLIFEVDGAGRSLDLTRIEAVAVAAVAQEGGRPYLLIDLLFDPPWDGAGDLRLLRFRSSSFDPRKVVGGDQPMAAFGALLERLLGISGAAPLPDAERVRDPGARTFGSIEDYQQEVLGVMG